VPEFLEKLDAAGLVALPGKRAGRREDCIWSSTNGRVDEKIAFYRHTDLIGIGAVRTPWRLSLENAAVLSNLLSFCKVKSPRSHCGR
jgi:hypothetical protein